MNDNPYRPPEAGTAFIPPADRNGYWLSHWGMVALAVVLGVFASVLTFGGRYLSTPVLQNAFGFGGLGFCVVAVALVSVRLGLRYSRYSGWRSCVGTSFAGSMAFLFSVLFQMPRGPVFRDFGMLFAVVAVASIGSLLVLSGIRFRQKQLP